MKSRCAAPLVFLLIIMAVAGPVAAQDDLHGSISFSQEPDGRYAWGMAWNYGNEVVAMQNASAECQRAGGSNCREAGWFKNACGALAIGNNNGYGAGWGDSIAEAENDALAYCRSLNSNCRIEASRCAQGAATFASSDPGVSAATDAAAQDDLHGSIAFSQEPDGRYAWGMAWKYGSEAVAMYEASVECQRAGGSSCGEVGWFKNACGALAIGSNNGYGAGWGDSIAKAENDALAQCRSLNGNCRIETSQCAQGEATFASSAPGFDDDSKMAYEEDDGSGEDMEMSYGAELRALEAKAEAERRAEAARIEEARRQEAARRAEAEAERRAEAARIEEARRQEAARRAEAKRRAEAEAARRAEAEAEAERRAEEAEERRAEERRRAELERINKENMRRVGEYIERTRRQIEQLNRDRSVGPQEDVCDPPESATWIC